MRCHVSIRDKTILILGFVGWCELHQMLSELGLVGMKKVVVRDSLNHLPQSSYNKMACALCKLVTCPLWCVLEDQDVSITDMNMNYLQVVTFLEDASKNIQSFMNRRTSFVW